MAMRLLRSALLMGGTPAINASAGLSAIINPTGSTCASLPPGRIQKAVITILDALCSGGAGWQGE